MTNPQNNLYSVEEIVKELGIHDCLFASDYEPDEPVVPFERVQRLIEALTSHTKAIREEEIQFILKRLEANEYQTSDELREESESEYWLEYEEALEMAYDNQHDQVEHIKGVLRKRLQALNKQ